MEDKNQLKIIKTKAKAFEVVKSYYKDLDDLAARLQADYAAGEDYKPSVANQQNVKIEIIPQEAQNGKRN